MGREEECAVRRGQEGAARPLDAGDRDGDGDMDERMKKGRQKETIGTGKAGNR